jgi:hypothetical protein
MNPFRRSTDSLPSILLIALAGLLGACGGATVESVCGKCKNSGECVSEGTSEQARAEKIGCGEQFQSLLDCAEEKATCDGDNLEIDKACGAEDAALEKCGKGK